MVYERLKNTLIAGGLASILISGTGCETTGDDSESLALMSMITGANSALSTNPQQAATWGVLSRGSALASQNEARKEAAREGRSQVNVYTQSQPQQQRQEKPMSHWSPELKNRFEIANRDGLYVAIWKDTDGDGTCDIDTDYFNETTEFKEDDNIFIISKVPDGIQSATLAIGDLNNNIATPYKKFNKEGPGGDQLFFYNVILSGSNPYRCGKWEFDIMLFSPDSDEPYATKRIPTDFGKPKKNGAMMFMHRELEEVIISTCNYFEDFNGDNWHNFPEEFVGIKDKFYTDEQITTYFSTGKLLKNEDVDIKLLNNSSKEVESKRDSEFEKTHASDSSEGYGFFQTYSPGELNPGIYTSTFSYKGEFLGKLEIEVLER